jgi:hypothetical protein
MRAVFLAFVVGVALAASAQAAPFASKPTLIELGAVPPVELVRDGCGRGSHRTRWRDQWAIGNGVTAFRTKVVLTAAMAQGGTIPTQSGAVFLIIGVGATHISDTRAIRKTDPR